MKLTCVALAGASLLAFATPAAAGDGWYLGLGAGWSKPRDVSDKSPGGAIGKLEYDNTARYDFAAGYKWASGLRLELEALQCRSLRSQIITVANKFFPVR